MTPISQRQKTLTLVVLCAFVFVLPIVIWYISSGNPVRYFVREVPPGQVPYFFSKLAGLLAFSCFWLQCLFALSRRVPVLGNTLPSIRPRRHIFLGLLTFVLVIAHLGLFFAAVTLRTGSPAWSLLIPQFSQGYYQLHVSLDLVGLWLLFFGIFAGWQTYPGKRGWRKAHMVWVAVFILVFWHAFTIGSESRYGIMRYVYVLMATGLSWIVISCVTVQLRALRGRSVNCETGERNY